MWGECGGDDSALLSIQWGFEGSAQLSAYANREQSVIGFGPQITLRLSHRCWVILRFSEQSAWVWIMLDSTPLRTKSDWVNHEMICQSKSVCSALEEVSLKPEQVNIVTQHPDSPLTRRANPQAHSLLSAAEKLLLQYSFFSSKWKTKSNFRLPASLFATLSPSCLSLTARERSRFCCASKKTSLIELRDYNK